MRFCYGCFPGASEHFSGPTRQEYSRALKNKDVNYSSLMLTPESKTVPARRRTELKCDAHRKYSRLLKDTNYEFRKILHGEANVLDIDKHLRMLR